MHILPQRRLFGFTLLFFFGFSSLIFAQDEKKPPAAKKIELPKILDEPKTVDPATLVPKQLAVPVTVNFTDSTLREIMQWIREEQKIAVLFDNRALSEEGILLGEPVADRLDGDPIYLLLNRLSSLGVAWYVEDDILHITTIIEAEDRSSTKSYNVSDLLDTGYNPIDFESTIHQATAGPWEDQEGSGGSMEWLGDVLFVRQTDRMHRQVAGLITALRKHSRQTFTLDPPQHLTLRQKLNENVSVKFQNTPLFRAMQELAEQTKIDIRLDKPALKEEGVRDREPVSLTLSNRKLSTALHVLLADIGLTWILNDGVLWITTEIQAEDYRKTVVYDVRDLCRNRAESTELTAAIQAQTNGPWEATAGSGGTIVFPKAGTMVVHQTERILQEVLDLLAAYRKALLASKPRDRDAKKSQEVVTRYYRIHENIADDLAKILPQLVLPETWKSAQKPDSPGNILRLASGPELLDPQGRVVHASTKDADVPRTDALVVSRSVLIIRQTRAAHKEIAEVIRRVERGDPTEEATGVGLGGVGGQGGGG